MQTSWPLRLCPAGNAGFIEDLYEKFLQDPASVDPAWAKYFGDLAGASTREGGAW